MKRITRIATALKYEFDARHEPLLEVEIGDSFVLETEDSSTGSYRTLEDAAHLLSASYLKPTPPRANPITGPVYVKGVKAGDVLVVSIERIELDVQGYTFWRPGHKPLGDSVRWRDLSQPRLFIAHYKPGPTGTLRDGTAVIEEGALLSEDSKVEKFQLSKPMVLPLCPFIGTLGVAPEREVETSIVGQGAWGGNLDCRDIKEGTKVYINAYHDGALFYVGDAHACQGDTEFSGTALETRAAVTLRCDVIKNKRIPFVRLEKPESIVQLYCYRPLEEAVKAATFHLMEWLIEEHGFSQSEAYLTAAVNPSFRINIYQMAQIGRIQYTVGAEVSKACIT